MARHSRQIVVMRSISLCARAHTLWPGKTRLRFIGSAERRFENPECISPQTARQCARAARSAGNNPLFGLTSLKYSAMASVSHTLIPSWVRHGTRIDGESRRISLRASASSGETMTSLKSRPANLARSHPRNDHEESFLLLFATAAL